MSSVKKSESDRLLADEEENMTSTKTTLTTPRISHAIGGSLLTSLFTVLLICIPTEGKVLDINTGSPDVEYDYNNILAVYKS